LIRRVQMPQLQEQVKKDPESVEAVTRSEVIDS
jgi:hypothetical protein